MSQDIEQAIEQYMKHESLSGHFEHSRSEVEDGVGRGFSRDDILIALERMVGRGILGRRIKARFTFYYLMEIVKMCKKAWGKEFGLE